VDWQNLDPVVGCVLIRDVRFFTDNPAGGSTERMALTSISAMTRPRSRASSPGRITARADEQWRAEGRRGKSDGPAADANSPRHGGADRHQAAARLEADPTRRYGSGTERARSGGVVARFHRLLASLSR